MRPLAPAALFCILLNCLLLSGRAEAHIDPADPRYENTIAKDFIMDAPWRVRGPSTPIPVTVIIKDCDVDDVRELHWIRIWDETNGDVMLWDHSFNDEEIGDNASEQNFWTVITKITEGNPNLPDGTLLSPTNLGYGTGAVIKLRVSIYYKDDFFNYTETRHLRVRVGGGPFPWPAGWYGGDVHYHTMYTNNIYEYGAPLPAVKEAARAMGLHWLTATDHSSDIDETGDGTYAYATPQWEYTVFDQTGPRTYYRDVAADGGTWQGLGVDVNQLDGPDFRLYRAVELNLGSIDPGTLGKTLHCLIYNESYIHSPDSGGPGENPISPDIDGALSQIQGTGFAYSSHPLNNLSAEFLGFDIGANGTFWGPATIQRALTYEAFRGLQIFNTRSTVTSTNQNNPWAEFDAGVPVDNAYPAELLEGVALWDELVTGLINAQDPRRIFVAGGSDAHGDFNYSTHLSVDDYAEDNAIGKAQTVAYVPGNWSPTNLPPMSEILAAYRAGRTIITDGPFVEIGIDTDNDDDWTGPEDLVLGQAGTLHPETGAVMHVRWDSLPEFGIVSAIRVLAVDGNGTVVLESFGPFATTSGATTITLGNRGYSGRVSFRAELQTVDGQAGYRAYTNPIEVDFDSTAGNPDPDPDPLPTVNFPVPVNVPNPFNPETEIRFTLAQDSQISLDIYAATGGLVRRLVGTQWVLKGNYTVKWDGRDLQGQEVPSGIYLYEINTSQGPQTGKMSLVR